MKTILLLSVCLAFVTATSLSSNAGEPAWWTQQKSTCGLPASLTYNDWAAQGYPCHSASAPASGDPAVQLGTTLGTAVGNVIGAAIVQSLRQDNADADASERAIAEAQRRAKAQDAEQVAEQERNDAQKQEQSYERLKGELKLPDSDASPDLSSGGLKLKSDEESASLAPPPRQLGKETDPDSNNSLRTAAYIKGKKGASDCLSQNAGGYCVGLSPADTMTCTNDYHGGYTRGERAATETLKRLYKLGEDDRRAKHAYNGLSTGVEGTCGVHAVEAYNSGFYGAPFTAIGR